MSTLQELEQRVIALRSEYDERYGATWPADAIEAFDRATQELAQAIDAAEQRQRKLEAAEAARAKLADLEAQVGSPGTELEFAL